METQSNTLIYFRFDCHRPVSCVASVYGCPFLNAPSVFAQVYYLIQVSVRKTISTKENY